MTNEIAATGCVVGTRQLAVLKKAARDYSRHLRREADEARRAGRVEQAQRLIDEATTIGIACH